LCGRDHSVATSTSHIPSLQKTNIFMSKKFRILLRESNPSIRYFICIL